MRPETAEELKNYPSIQRHPSPFAKPVLALAVAGIIGLSAAYANHLRGDVFQVLDEDYRVNDFEHIVSLSPLKESFQEDAWEYTVVAPTDQAFDKAQWQTTRAIQGVSPAAEPSYQDVSAYDYVVASPVNPDEVKFGEHVRIPSISGHDLVFSRVGEGDDGLRINGLPVNTVRHADNGVVYLIDDMIAFPQMDSQQQLTWNR